MGILDKIEDKLGGNKHGNTSEKPLYSGNERKSLEKQAAGHGQQLPGHTGSPGQTSSSGYGTSGSGLTGTGAATSGVGAGATSGLYGSSTGTSSQPHGSSTTGSSTTGGRAQELRHPVSSATTGTALGQPGQYSSNNIGHGYGSGSTNVDNDGYGSTSGGTSGAHKTHPVEAVDPHSTKGQNAMYHASSGGPSTGHGTSTNDYGIPGRASTDDVDRSRHGGITNSTNLSGNDHTGGGYNLTNPSAIPIAGGQKVGGVGENENHRDHHLGRDAAGVAGAGALGTGAYEAERKHHHGHGQDSSRITGGDNYGTSGLSSTTGGRDNYGSSGISNTTGTGRDHHYGRDAAVGAGALGTAGAYEEQKHRDRDETGHHLGGKHHNEYSSTGRDQLPQASSYPETSNSSNDQYGSGNTGLSSGNKDHHYGRDAAFAGTGALGAGEYERKHHDRDNLRDDKYDNSTSSSSGGVGSTIKNKLGMGSSTTNTNTNTGISSRGNEHGSSHRHHDDEEREIEERLEEIRLNRRLKEIRAGRQV